MKVPSSKLLFLTCHLKRGEKIETRITLIYLSAFVKVRKPIPCVCNKYQGSGMSFLTPREMQQEGFWWETQSFGLQGLHMHLCGEAGMFHHSEPLIPGVMRWEEGPVHQWQEWLEQHQMRVRHILLGRNDQKVIEKVNVYADKWHPCAVSGVDGQLPHGTLVHQEAPADHQGNPLKGEEAGKDHYCHTLDTQQKVLLEILARNPTKWSPWLQ